MKETKHVPVMLEEVMEYLDVRPGGVYIDATLGGGGYTKELLRRSEPDGVVLAIDMNEQALEHMRERFGSGSKTHEKRKPSVRSRSEPVPEGGGVPHERLMLVHDNFRSVTAIARSHNLYDVSGVVFDLGLSSDLLESAGRGFSFKRDEPLLMTFSEGEALKGGLTAAQVLNTYPEPDLLRVFTELGEERWAKRIAKYIVEKREKKRFETSGELSQAIEEAVGRADTKIFARIFQALRIEVNDELAALQEGLEGAWDVLGSGGRLVVVSYHSLEDRVVKRFMREMAKSNQGEIVTAKPRRPSEKEVADNAKSRSARLRAMAKAS